VIHIGLENSLIPIIIRQALFHQIFQRAHSETELTQSRPMPRNALLGIRSSDWLVGKLIGETNAIIHYPTQERYQLFELLVW
jgi:hypothetical protein